MGESFSITQIISAILAVGGSAFIAYFITSKTNNLNTRRYVAMSSEIKMAEFRHAEINELRDCMAQIQALGTVPGYNPRNDSEFYRIGTKIELLMSPDDEDFNVLQNLLYKYLDSSDGDVMEEYRINPDYIDVCQRILQRERQRVESSLKITARL